MAFSSIRIEGAILSPEILDQISKGTRSHQEGDSFGLPSRTSVKDEIQFAWGEAVHHWKIFRQRLERLRKSETTEGVTRKYWVVPLLELLGYELESSNAEMVAGKSYAINHRVPALGGFPIQIVSCDRELDKRAVDGGPRLSPHGLLQEYLNVTEHLYGIVTNGETLRLLRDNSRLIRLSYLEFDLRRMMEEDQYGEFALLYRLLHQSRMPRDPGATGESILERYHQDSLEDGARIRAGLSTAVKECMEKMGTGLLRHPANTSLREQILSGSQEPRAFLQTLFHEIYRVLFLMVLEERALIFPDATDPRFREAYYRYYSLRKVRLQSEHIPLFPERYSDLWMGLRETFQLFSPTGNGVALGVPPLGGELFSALGLAELHDWSLDNKTLLECFALLNSFEDPQTHTRIRVNYAALNVEEFGSVYETLLEREGRFTGLGQEMSFVLVKGDERGETGSHYTPDTLVVPLIQHSLDHLIEERLAASSDKKGREEALLTLRICDPSCGSGHILLNASRRVGLELARVRTGEDQPAPSYVRWAVRDVIAHCIYGVDKNPLAVELCKVALWLESHTPGEPLGFLDHRIKCGDAVVGLCRREELERGISEEAFAAVGNLSAEDKKALSEMRKRIAQEKRVAAGVQAGTELFASVGQTVNDLLQKLSDVDALPEHTPDEVERKRLAYQGLLKGDLWWRLKTLADVQVGQFFIPKTINKNHLWVSEAEYRRELTTPHSIVGQRAGVAIAESESRRFFHWFLEFPEVFAKGGFNCVLGNPPFVSSREISSNYGSQYLNYLTANFGGAAIEYCAYFFLRAYNILAKDGYTGLLATKGIAHGVSMENSLGAIVALGGQIIHAKRNQPWPGSASVHVSAVNIFKGDWRSERILDERRVSQISAHLDESQSVIDPWDLELNSNICFQGSIVSGAGFVIDAELAEDLLQKNPLNSEVVFPYLDGDDLTSNPGQSATRWVVNFAELSEEQASKYLLVFELLSNRVKEERQQHKDVNVRKYPWWRLWRPRTHLYSLVEKLPHVFVINRHSKHPLFTPQNRKVIYSEATVVVCESGDEWYCALNSQIHLAWAWKYCGTIGGGRLRYGSKRAFGRFPFPTLLGLSETGKAAREMQEYLRCLLSIGLTDLYNLFHNKALCYSEFSTDLALESRHAKRDFIECFGKDVFSLWKRCSDKYVDIPFRDVVALVEDLRGLHRRMDEQLVEAYGWHKAGEDGPAIRLEHGFHEVDYLPEKDRVRYTISPAARKEILHRLLLLNHKRHAEEVARNGGKAAWVSGDDDADEPLVGGEDSAPKPKAARAKKASKAGQEELGL
jgi:hypothetical protein